MLWLSEGEPPVFKNDTYDWANGGRFIPIDELTEICYDEWAPVAWDRDVAPFVTEHTDEFPRVYVRRYASQYYRYNTWNRYNTWKVEVFTGLVLGSIGWDSCLWTWQPVTRRWTDKFVP